MQSFATAIRTSDFVITASLSLHPDSGAGTIRDRVKALRGIVSGVQVDDDYASAGPVDPLAVASLVLGEGVDPILQLSCRDRNKLALRGELLGLVALGASSVLLARGEKIPERMRGKVKGVFDTTATQFIQMARQIGGEAEGADGPLFVGTFAPVIRPSKGWKANRVREKISAGAKFVQTRPCLNVLVLQHYMARLIELGIPREASLIVDVPLLTSGDSVRRFSENYPSVRIPGTISKRIVGASDPAREGALVCGEFIEAVREVAGVSGVNIVGSPDPRLTALAIERSRESAG